MKVIGIVDDYTYLCEMKHTEIEKFTNLYYDKMKKMRVGDVLDLGKGYNFHIETLDALRKTEEFIKANKDVINAIMNGITTSANMLEIKEASSEQ